MTHLAAVNKTSRQIPLVRQCTPSPNGCNPRVSIRKGSDYIRLVNGLIGSPKQIFEIEGKMHYKWMPPHLHLVLQTVVLPLLLPEYMLRCIKWKVTFYNRTNTCHYLGNILCIFLLKAHCFVCNWIAHLQSIMLLSNRTILELNEDSLDVHPSHLNSDPYIGCDCWLRCYQPCFQGD